MDGVVISGYGLTPLSRTYGESAASLAVQAVSIACADAGLTRADLDGLVLARSPILLPRELPLDIHQLLGLQALRLLTAIDASGTSMLQAVQTAGMAIRTGLATHVACVFADTPIRAEKTSQASFSRPMRISGVPGAEEQVGLLGAVGGFGLMTRSYMARHSSNEATMARYSIAARSWASLAPEALQRSELTLDGYLSSPYVVDPIRLVDCALPVNGAFAVVVSNAARVPRSETCVHVHAMAQGHAIDIPVSGEINGRCAAVKALADRLYREAGVTPSQVESLQCYDAFPILGLRALEDYGLCEPGGAAAFVAEGRTARGGSLPMNSGGGHIAGFYLQGATPLHEALVQLRQQGGARQIRSDGPVLVTGVGSRYVHHAAILLGREPAPRFTQSDN